jgi:serine/threonine protein phosphatase PrpC
MAITAAGGCPSCGAQVGPQDSFCEACGTELAPASVSSGEPDGSRGCPSCPGAPISPDGYCESCGRKVPAGRDHQELDLGLLAGVTDRGLRHRRNEDAMALATAQTASGPAAVAVVCDGVSSSARPDEASLVASQAAIRMLLAAVRAGDDLLEASAAAVRAAGQAVTDLAGPSQDVPSATLVGAVLTGGTVTVCWLGDSRAYWLAEAGADHPGPGSRQLTTDDSLAAEMVTRGLLAEADAMASPHAHVLTRWLGADPGDSAAHVTTFQPPGPGVLLLCSDGLWNYQPDPAGLAGLALPGALTDPLAAAAALVRFAVEAGGADNITAVLTPFPLARPSPDTLDGRPPPGDPT